MVRRLASLTTTSRAGTPERRASSSTEASRSGSSSGEVRWKSGSINRGESAARARVPAPPSAASPSGQPRGARCISSTTAAPSAGRETGLQRRGLAHVAEPGAERLGDQAVAPPPGVAGGGERQPGGDLGQGEPAPEGGPGRRVAPAGGAGQRRRPTPRARARRRRSAPGRAVPRRARGPTPRGGSGGCAAATPGRTSPPGEPAPRAAAPRGGRRGAGPARRPRRRRRRPGPAGRGGRCAPHYRRARPHHETEGRPPRPRSPCSATSTATARPSRPCCARSGNPAPASGGAWATWWATAPTRCTAWRCARRAPRAAWPAITTWAPPAASTWTTSPTTRTRRWPGPAASWGRSGGPSSTGSRRPTPTARCRSTTPACGIRYGSTCSTWRPRPRASSE